MSSENPFKKKKSLINMSSVLDFAPAIPVMMDTSFDFMLVCVFFLFNKK